MSSNARTRVAAHSPHCDDDLVVTLDYARFLPEPLRDDARLPPTSTWWEWRSNVIHIARAERPDAATRVMIVHGAGGHSGALWPFASLAATYGSDVLAPDLPLYGQTEVSDLGAVRYSDWVDLLCDLIEEETRRDARPLVLVGASMGGMLAYEAAARTRKGAAVVATCLLDPSDAASLHAALRLKISASTVQQLARRTPKAFHRVPLPVRWFAPISKMSKNPELSKQCALDPFGGGAQVPLGFLTSFVRFQHTAPEEYAGPPVTLAHPEHDAWTPLDNSRRFAKRIAGATVTVLENCGHFPIEEPGVTTLLETIRSAGRPSA